MIMNVGYLYFKDINVGYPYLKDMNAGSILKRNEYRISYFTNMIVNLRIYPYFTKMIMNLRISIFQDKNYLLGKSRPHFTKIV